MVMVQLGGLDGQDLALLWVWRRPTAPAPVVPLATVFHMPWMQTQKPKKKKKKEQNYITCLKVTFIEWRDFQGMNDNDY